MSGAVAVALLEEIPPGTARTVTVGEQPVALFNHDGTIHAYDGVCLHRGGPVGDGDVEDGVVTCPWHGWQYRVQTGCTLLDQSVCLRRHEVFVEDGKVYLRPAP